MNAITPAAGSPSPSGSGAQLVDSKQLSAEIGVPVETLSKWRQLGTGPKFIRLPSGRVRYDREDVGNWLDSLKHS